MPQLLHLPDFHAYMPRIESDPILTQKDEKVRLSSLNDIMDLIYKAIFKRNGHDKKPYPYLRLAYICKGKGDLVFCWKV